MVVDDIIRVTKRICDNDQSIQTNDMQDWIDMGIDEINKYLMVNIPHISGKPTNSTSPSFDARYHNTLVNFCVAKYREGDSDYNAANYFMKQFGDQLDMMQRDMPKNPSIRMDYNVIQIVPSSANQTLFDLKIPNGAYFDDIEIYQNDNDITDYCTLNYRAKQFTVDPTYVVTAVTDTITIIWNMDSALNQAPFEWFERMEW